MEDGGWRMEDGGWRMEDGGWRMEDEYHRTAMNSCLKRIYEPLFSSKTSKIYGLTRHNSANCT
jgi:hypothetical protein